MTRRSIQRAFEDLVITESTFNEIGPAINSAASIFFFGYPGNGKTSIAERITRLMGDTIYVPHAVEANGQIVTRLRPDPPHRRERGTGHRRGEPVPQVGDHGVRPAVRPHQAADDRGRRRTHDAACSTSSTTRSDKYYEAPLQMKANGGIFMIDDFGRQQMRPMDLLNRWIVPLEKKYDYLTTITGTKIEMPFDDPAHFQHESRPDPTGRRGVPPADQVQNRSARPGRSSVPPDLGTRLCRPEGSSTTPPGSTTCQQVVPPVHRGRSACASRGTCSTR